MKLRDIGYITLGYSFRAAVTPDENGAIFLLQASNVIRGVPITDTNGLTPISFEMPGYAGHLRESDVLLVSRGGTKEGTFRSTVFMSNAENVIASASILIIRITSINVLPEYLSLYLNSKRGQNALTEIVTGSYIGSIPKKELEKVNVLIPDLKKQKAIIDLYQNMQMQQKILDRRNKLKQQVIEATFTNLTKHHD